MKLLIVAATRMEIKPLEDYLIQLDQQGLLKLHAIELMITGAGMVQTAFRLGKLLPMDNWDLAINLGICGSFNRQLLPGTTVQVVSDTFGDMGAEDGEAFLDSFEIGLTDRDAYPFMNGWIHNMAATEYEVLQSIPAVRGITMNTVSGNEINIRKRVKKFAADVESMEGAAFFYCCKHESIPCLQIRTVSNYIERRDKNQWNIPLAISKLNETAIRLLQEIISPAMP